MTILAKIDIHYYDQSTDGVKKGDLVEYEGRLHRVSKVEEVNAGDQEVNVELKEIRQAVKRSR